MELIKKEGLTAYDEYEKVVHTNVSESEKNAIGPEIVAKKIFFAAERPEFSPALSCRQSCAVVVVGFCEACCH